ncbi:MAG: hypothetical protein U1F68_10175 [Gammaproteobacteria bacterium]
MISVIPQQSRWLQCSCAPAWLLKFLAENMPSISKNFKLPQHWKWASRELYEAYGRICAYSCIYIPSSYGWTIDHFLPKSQYPNQAYEWGNFRLALQKMNSYKGDNTDIVDPFAVQPGWFVLDFPSCLVKPGSGLVEDIKSRVEKTIKVLKLNDDDGLVQDRCDIIVMFSRGDITFLFLKQNYPFLAAEVIRQGIQTTVNQIFKMPRKYV